MAPRRVIVIGSTCAGKSTFGARLAEVLGVPLIELDALYWMPGWQPSDKALFRAKVDAETSAGAWVLAGSYLGPQQDISWPRADTIVWLDPPLPVIVARVFRRSLERWWTGELLWGTNRERFFSQLKLWDENASLIAFAIRHHRSRRRDYSAAMRDARFRHIEFHRFHSLGSAAEWLSKVRLEK